MEYKYFLVNGTNTICRFVFNKQEKKNDLIGQIFDLRSKEWKKDASTMKWSVDGKLKEISYSKAQSLICSLKSNKKNKDLGK
jgi:hypothetical protein